MTDLSPLNTLGILALIVVSNVVVWWIARGTAPEPEGPQTDTVRVEEKMGVGDLVEATAPTTVTIYEAPDSQDTRTDCITVPTWMPSIHTAEPHGASASAMQPEPPETGLSDTAKTTGKSRTVNSPPSMAGLPYVIIPTTNGRPNVSVGTRRVTLSSIDPRTGAGRKYEYEVPRPTWLLSARGSAVTTRQAAVGLSTVQVRHRGDWGTLGIGPAATAVVTSQGYEAGLGISLSIQTTLWSR